MFSRFQKHNNDASATDDSVVVTAKAILGKGCLDKDIRLPTYGLPTYRIPPYRLPTYRTKDATAKTIYSRAAYVALTIDDVLLTISQQTQLARRVLFETARLKGPLFSWRPLKLSQNPRLIDEKLIELDNFVRKGFDLIASEKGDRQDRVIKGTAFRKAQSTAKKSLLDLEKAFNDNVLGDLKKGMRRRSRGSVDHEKIVTTIKHMTNEILTVYNKLTTAYNEISRDVGGTGHPDWSWGR